MHEDARERANGAEASVDGTGIPQGGDAAAGQGNGPGASARGDGGVRDSVARERAEATRGCRGKWWGSERGRDRVDGIEGVRGGRQETRFADEEAAGRIRTDDATVSARAHRAEGDGRGTKRVESGVSGVTTTGSGEEEAVGGEFRGDDDECAQICRTVEANV